MHVILKSNWFSTADCETEINAHLQCGVCQSEKWCLCNYLYVI